MRRAVVVAASGLGTTSPNPVVGAVILDAHGEVVGEGAHVGGPGNPHAEIVALRAAGDRARGGTAVVTLEPCNHLGRTGPCVDALLDAGVVRVVYAIDDPYQPAAGGAQALRAAGVDVVGGVLAADARLGNEAWLHAVTTGRPFVTWKFAATLDGRTAAADGTSRWVSGPESRADTHALRAQADAVLAGVGTILADDPLLTVRDADGSPLVRQPWRVVLDSDGRTPAAARVLGERALVVLGEGAKPPAGADHVTVRRGADGRIEPLAALEALHDRGIRHVFIEGGATVAASFARAGLVDKVVAYLAPMLLGAGTPVLRDIGITTIAEACRLRLDEVTRVGEDVRLTLRRTHGTVEGGR